MAGKKKYKNCGARIVVRKKGNLDKYKMGGRRREQESDKETKDSMKLYEESGADETRGCVLATVWNGLQQRQIKTH